MGNRRAREFTLQQHDNVDWEQVRTAIRSATSDVHARGIGIRRLQLIVCPSFDEPRAWEVRQREDEWRLFGSRVAAPWPDIQLVGYELLAADPAMLAAFFDRAATLTLPISPYLSGMAGLDGTVSQLGVLSASGFHRVR